MADDAEHLITEEALGRPGITLEDFERLYPKVVAVLRKKGVSYEDACDLAQTALLEAHKSFHKFQGRSDLDTWVVSIAKNLLLQDLRNRRRQKRSAEEVPLDDSLHAEGFEEQVIARDLMEQACKAIRALPEEQQQPLVLLGRGFKYREIAKILNISENRVSSLIHQARKKLRRELRGRAVDSAR